MPSESKPAVPLVKEMAEAAAHEILDVVLGKHNHKHPLVRKIAQIIVAHINGEPYA